MIDNVGCTNSKLVHKVAQYLLFSLHGYTCSFQMHHSHDKFGIDESLLDHNVFNIYIIMWRDMGKIMREKEMRKERNEKRGFATIVTFIS